MGSEGRGKGRALCGLYCVPRLHPISYTKGTHRVGFSPTSRISFKSFFNKVLSSLFGVFCFAFNWEQQQSSEYHMQMLQGHESTR